MPAAAELIRPAVSDALTPAQFKLLDNAFKRGGAAYTLGISRRGGALRHCMARMVKERLLADQAPYPLTRRGLLRLEAAYAARAAKRACVAFDQDLVLLRTTIAECVA